MRLYSSTRISEGSICCWGLCRGHHIVEGSHLILYQWQGWLSGDAVLIQNCIQRNTSDKLATSSSRWTKTHKLKENQKHKGTNPARPGANFTWTSSTVSSVRFGQDASTEAASNCREVMRMIEIGYNENFIYCDCIMVMIAVLTCHLFVAPFKAQAMNSLASTRWSA